MGKFSFVAAEDRVRVIGGTNVSKEAKHKLSKGELEAEKLQYFPVDGERLELYEVRLRPDTDIQSHAHTEDEIILITGGEIHLGRRVLAAGAALYVEKETLYAFRAGPDGCAFLNFRPSPRTGYLTKEELMARRAEAER